MKKEKETKNKKIEIRVTDKELKIIDYMVKKNRMTRSEFILNRVLNYSVDKDTDIKVSRAVTLLQQLLNDLSEGMIKAEEMEKRVDGIWNLLL